jgi:hypothetical protein
METWRLTLEQWRLTLEPWRLTLELEAHAGAWRITLGGANPGATGA